ncbi:MAG: alpha/beta hydrolase [Fuerstiella sp.]
MHNARRKRSWRRKILRGVAVYAVLPYLSVTAIFTLTQRRLMYRPSVADSLCVTALNLDSERTSDVQIKTPDGDVLNGWLLKSANADEATKRLLIYFPGNSMNRLERVSDLREVASFGYDVLIFDYRGFGDSTGSPTETRLSADAKLIWRYATGELGWREAEVVVFGESLGGAVAVSLWSDNGLSNDHAISPHPKAVILSSTFASMPRTVQWNYPWFPFQYLVFDRWSSIDRISEVASPITILHGADDEMVPVAEARALAAANQNAEFVELPGAGHNDVPLRQLQSLLQQ